MDADFEIIGMTPHSKREGEVGAILFKTLCGTLECSTGSGMSDAQRKEFWENKDSYIGKIVKVKYNKVIPHATKKGAFSLFLPVLDSKDIIRHDKTVSDNLVDIDWGNKDADKKKWLKSK
jgi:DNA ligase-1